MESLMTKCYSIFQSRRYITPILDFEREPANARMLSISSTTFVTDSLEGNADVANMSSFSENVAVIRCVFGLLLFKTMLYAIF